MWNLSSPKPKGNLFLLPTTWSQKTLASEFPHVAHSYLLSITEKLLRSLGPSSPPNFLSWETAQTPSCPSYHLTLKSLCFLKTRGNLPAQSMRLVKVMHQGKSPLPSPILGLHREEGGEERERRAIWQKGSCLICFPSSLEPPPPT